MAAFEEGRDLDPQNPDWDKEAQGPFYKVAVCPRLLWR